MLSLDVGAELVRRLQEGAPVPEAVRGRVVTSLQHLLDEVRVVLRGQAEQEERRLRLDFVQEAEDGIHLAYEGRVRRVPAGDPGTLEHQLVPVLEVDAQQQRPVVRRNLRLSRRESAAVRSQDSGQRAGAAGLTLRQRRMIAPGRAVATETA